MNKKNNTSKWVILIIALVIGGNILITHLTTEKIPEIETISFKRYKEELENKDQKLILISENDCIECDSLNDVLKQVANEHKIKAYSINIDDLSETDLVDLKQSGPIGDTSTFPIILRINNGDLIDSHVGEAAYDDILDFVSDIEKITINRYIEMMKEDVEHFVYIGRPTCHYCTLSEPWLKIVSYEMNRRIYYINIDEISESDHTLLANITDDIYRGATPLFIISKGNEIIDYTEGVGSYIDLSNFFGQIDR